MSLIMAAPDALPNLVGDLLLLVQRMCNEHEKKTSQTQQFSKRDVDGNMLKSWFGDGPGQRGGS